MEQEKNENSDTICTACKGTKIQEVICIGGVTVYPHQNKPCFYCGGSGLRRDQIFNWLQGKNKTYSVLYNEQIENIEYMEYIPKNPKKIKSEWTL